MKVVTPKQMSELESLAYKDGASESEFMEEAGSGIALLVQEFVERYGIDRVAILLCGKGNNAGDAYVAGIQLLQLEYEVIAIHPISLTECSRLCKQNHERFIREGGRVMEKILEFPMNGVIIDGIFGTGFRGNVSEPFKSLITAANEAGLPIISVDIPSGLNGETGIVEEEAIIADETAFLGLPKQGFFLNNGWDHTGKLQYIDFGLDVEYIEKAESKIVMLTEEYVQPLLPKIKRSRHKYQAGYVVGIAGSTLMPGAAILSSSAALRSGAGIVRLFYPEGMRYELSASPYELICTPYTNNDLKELQDHIKRAASVFIGPGIGKSTSVKSLLRQILPLIEKPCVIDADALTIITEENLAFPNQTVLTPHHGEMMKLLQSYEKPPMLTLDFLEECHRYAAQKEITLVLKGAPTFVLQRDYPMYANPTGDPGMATAGSGDVLTGLIAALLAQGCSPLDAACLGVFLHGRAGEFAAEDMTSYCMCASDIIYRFPEAFKSTI
jgi:hydroxyethylthiazole kinase-like uncharacterized protein yjeF